MISEEFLTNETQKLEGLMCELEANTLIDIARRISKQIRKGDPGIPMTAQYQLSRLAELRGFDAYYKSEIARITELALPELDRLTIEAANQSHAYDVKRFLESELPPLPEIGSERMHQITDAIRDHTENSFKNITKTMGFEGMEAREYFTSRLTQAEMEVASGLFDYNSVTRKTVQEMNKNGLQSLRDEFGRLRVQYERKNLNVVSAARMNVVTACRQIADQVSIANGEMLGLNILELSAHQGARTTGTGFQNHEQLQGRRYSLSSYEDLEKALNY